MGAARIGDHACAATASSASTEQRGVQLGLPASDRGRLSQKTMRLPRCLGGSRHHVDGGGLDLDQKHVGDPTSGSSSASRSAARFESEPTTAVTSAPWSSRSDCLQPIVNRSRRGGEVGHPLAARRPRPEPARARSRSPGCPVSASRPRRAPARPVAADANGGSHIVNTTMSDTNTRKGPMPVISSCDGRTADVTSNVRSAATGGIAAPEPSSSSMSGRSAAASSAAGQHIRRRRSRPPARRRSGEPPPWARRPAPRPRGSRKRRAHRRGRAASNS